MFGHIRDLGKVIYSIRRNVGRIKGRAEAEGVEDERELARKQKVVACCKKHPRAQRSPKGAKPPARGAETSGRGRPFTEECVCCVHRALQLLSVCNVSIKEREQQPPNYKPS